MLPRILADTNVLISALISPQGSPGRLLAMFRDGVFELLGSPKLLNELIGVLMRPKFRTYVTPVEARRYAVWLRHAASLVHDPEDVPTASPDPGDDFLIAVARAARATYLVSGDRHLIDLEEADPPVLTPAALLERLS